VIFQWGLAKCSLRPPLTAAVADWRIDVRWAIESIGAAMSMLRIDFVVLARTGAARMRAEIKHEE